MRETIQTKYQDMDVTYDVRRETWTVKIDETTALEEHAVKAINTALHAGITKHMEHEVTEYQARKEREEAERKAKEEAERMAAVAAWHEMVAKAMAELNLDLQWRVDAVNEIVLRRGDDTATVRHDSRVYRSGGSLRGDRTELVWVARVDFRDKRFRTMEQAVKNVDKNFTEKADTRKAKEERAKARTDKFNAKAAILKDYGLVLQEETDFIGDRYRRHGGHMVKRQFVEMGHVKAYLNDEDEPKAIKTIITCALNPGQFNRLVELVTSREFAEIC